MPGVPESSMDYPSRLIAPLALLLATTLAAACGSSTETPPPPPLPEATLAFTMDSSIYLISSDAGAPPSLLAGDLIEPNWRPDGGALAGVGTWPYPRGPGLPPNQALYLADVRSGGEFQVSEFDWPISGHPLWAPDATSMLFMRVSVMPSSAWVVRISEDGVVENTFGVAEGVPPSWSHDAALVALDSGGIISLIDPWADDTVGRVTGGWPQFSPVNDDLAFRDPTTGHIHLIRTDSTADRDLQVEGYPQIWSPDGTRLAFVGNDGIYMINADGSRLARIGPPDVEVSDAAWSADGRRLAYVTRPSSGPRTIYMAAADGSDPRPVVMAAELCCLAWRPEATLASRSSP